MTPSIPLPETPTVFVVGAPRSGTSLLYKALCLHPDAVWMSNWLRRFPRTLSLGRLNRLAARMPESRDRAWFAGGNAYVYGRSRKTSHRVFPQPVEGEPVFAACGVAEQLQDGPFDSETQTRLRATFGAIVRAGGGSTLVSKRIANNLRIPGLAAAFPSGRFVEIVRDGRAVAASLARVDWWPHSPLWWWKDRTPVEWAAEGNDPWEACAREWTEDVKLLHESLSALDPERVLQVRYEDLVAEPGRWLRRVAAFACLEPSETWQDRIDVMEFPPPDSERWRTDLAPDVQALVTEIEHDELVRLGYPVDLPRRHGTA